MDIKQAAEQLKDMYNNAPDKEAVTFIHLFGIKYAKEIISLSVPELVKESGIRQSYTTEVYKGIRLAKYVNLKIDL